MAPVCSMEYRRDCIGDRLYASRNHNQLRQTYTAPGANRTNVDWSLTLRQVRKNYKAPYSMSQNGASSMPTLTEANTTRRPEPLAAEHPDGAYHESTATVGRYQNLGNTGHMLNGLSRVSSQSSCGIDWQLNLRGGYHGQPEQKWRRFHTRPQQSFDMMAENCARENDKYQRSHITPQDRRPDPRTGAISIHTIRDDPINFHRQRGCEGSNTAQWRHLIEDRRHGHKARRSLEQETTLRFEEKDPNGAKLSDGRSDGCIVEMLGKKKWVGHIHPDADAFALHQPAPQGDPRLYQLSRMRIQAEPDEDNRAKRMQKQPRTDEGLSQLHPSQNVQESVREEED
eukprot:TRINITY_DN13587_c0_g1_i1.p1 TRINITY_DN13587_c0_g1~~TRINITY_DN13587_c0_g1_i1.p1  ORF type:complete len:341 (+),score=48.19 TRINITY_DN13587_c0_g1_i1:143-1165(+)